MRDDLKRIGYGHVTIPPVEVLSYGQFIHKYATAAFAKKQTQEHMDYLAAKSATLGVSAGPALVGGDGGVYDDVAGYATASASAEAQIYEGVSLNETGGRMASHNAALAK